MLQLIAAQYEEIKSARGALLAYCETMKPEELYQPIPAFNNSSIADLLVHNVNTYISWINNFGLGRNDSFYKTEDVKSLDVIRTLFEKVNVFMAEFLEKYENNFGEPFTALVKHRGLPMTLSPLQLYTHVITHEFHHKGQILTMSRILGYVPVDTDAIRLWSGINQQYDNSQLANCAKRGLEHSSIKNSKALFKACFREGGQA